MSGFDFDSVWNERRSFQVEGVSIPVARLLHFRFADEDGREQGARVGHWVFQKFLGPAHGK